MGLDIKHVVVGYFEAIQLRGATCHFAQRFPCGGFLVARKRMSDSKRKLCRALTTFGHAPQTSRLGYLVPCKSAVFGTWPWERTYGSFFGWMNIDLPPILMFTRGFVGFDPQPCALSIFFRHGGLGTY